MVYSRTHPRDQDRSILLLDVARRMFEQQIHDVVGHDELIEIFS